MVIDVLTRWFNREPKPESAETSGTETATGNDAIRHQMQQLMEMNPPSLPAWSNRFSLGEGVGDDMGLYSSPFGTADSLRYFDPSMMYAYAREHSPQSAAAVVEEPSRTMLQRAPVDIENLNLSDPRQKLATEAEELLGYTPLRTELKTPGKLKRALAQLEIEILDQESVTAYKKQMAAHYETAGKMRMPTWRLTKLKDYKKPVPEYALQKAVEIKRVLPEAEFYVEQLAVDPFLIVTLLPLRDFLTTERTLARELDPEMSVYVEVWSEPKFEEKM